MKKEELIKLGLTEEQAEKVAEASAEELKRFIPKSRFDEVNEAKKQLESDLKTRDKRLKDLKETDPEALKAEIEKLEETNKTTKKEYEAKIKQIQVDNAVERALITAKAKNIKAVRALLDLEKVELDGENIKGLDDQLKKLQEDEGSEFLFQTETSTQKTFKGIKPGEKKDGSPGGITKEQFQRMGYKERAEIFNTNKELYDSLIENE